MEYEFALTVPAATTAAAPYTSRLGLARGMLERARIHFPAGCQYLVHVQVRRGGHQIWPLEDDKDIAYEDFTWESIVPYPLLVAPYELQFLAWSPDADYNHTIRVGIEIGPAPTPTSLDRLIDALNKFFRMLPGWR